MSETFRTGSFAEGRVTVLTNKILQDQTLSFRARGVAAAAISYPRDYKWSAAELVKLSPTEKRDAIQTALKELQTAGYLSRTKHQNSKGHWVWSWKLSDDILPGHTVDGLSGYGDEEVEVPNTDYPVTVSPAQTPISAGRTVTGSSELGSSGNKILKEDNQTNKTLNNEILLRTNGSVGTREDRIEAEKSEVQNLKSAPTEENPWASAESDPHVGAGFGFEDQDPEQNLNQDPPKNLTPSPLPPFPGDEERARMIAEVGNAPLSPKVVTKEMLQEEFEHWHGTYGFPEDKAWAAARRALLPKYKCDAEDFLNTIPIELKDSEKSEFYEDVCTLFAKGWQGHELVSHLCFGHETAYSPVGSFRKRLKQLIIRNTVPEEVNAA
jgi:hypothetical protein